MSGVENGSARVRGFVLPGHGSPSALAHSLTPHQSRIDLPHNAWKSLQWLIEHGRGVQARQSAEQIRVDSQAGVTLRVPARLWEAVVGWLGHPNLPASKATWDKVWPQVARRWSDPARRHQLSKGWTPQMVPLGGQNVTVHFSAAGSHLLHSGLLVHTLETPRHGVSMRVSRGYGTNVDVTFLSDARVDGDDFDLAHALANGVLKLLGPALDECSPPQGAGYPLPPPFGERVG